MKIFWSVLFIVLCPKAQAFKNKSFAVGLGYYSQNVLGKTTTSPNSAPGFLGAPLYPLNLHYDFNLQSDWYLSPQLSYTLIPRSSAGDSAKITLTHFLFATGMNFGFSGRSHWDWFVAPGMIQYTIKGTGGTTVLSNGTGTATFALPGDSSTVRNVTMTTGGSFNFEDSRFGFDMIFEGLLSSKRTESFMLSYAYRFGGGN